MNRTIVVLVLAICLNCRLGSALERNSRRLLCDNFLGLFCGNSKCPPEGFDSVKDFDVRKYISAPWYIQEQMTNSYQRKNSLFCVRAKYELVDDGDITKGLRVFNYANIDKVNGEPMGAASTDDDQSFTELRALLPDESVPSKLKVGPKFLVDTLGQTVAETLFGNYWVVAVGESEDEELGYDWAIVSGGPPKVETDDGCRTGREFFNGVQVNGVGLWLFSRKEVDPEGTKVMREKARELGFDLSVLLPVEQKGCKYEGARQ
ncbi:hypothetical protein BSKO_07872 [Bryopsis sp. KO-2023]|nr:hypothetical protein BSKO_07872 [Bryopsis sp. KO-2023]